MRTSGDYFLGIGLLRRFAAADASAFWIGQRRNLTRPAGYEQVGRVNIAGPVTTEHNFIIMPTTPGTAFALGEKMKNPLEMYLADIYTVQANLAGVPAISLPLGKHSNGMPFGIQVMAGRFEENKLLEFAKRMMDLPAFWIGVTTSTLKIVKSLSTLKLIPLLFVSSK